MTVVAETVTVRERGRVAANHDRPRWSPAAYDAAPARTPQRLALTCIIPAYNEAESIEDTVRSVLAQSDPPEVVLVVDDGSDDGTGELARAAGATVIRPPRGTGSKAGAQSYALDIVETPLTMVLDADSTLTPLSLIHI